MGSLADRTGSSSGLLSALVIEPGKLIYILLGINAIHISNPTRIIPKRTKIKPKLWILVDDNFLPSGVIKITSVLLIFPLIGSFI
jgi:hypothetical protein